MALNSISTGINQGIGNIYAPVKAAGCSVVVKIILNYILCAIPAINIFGAVISTFACYAVAAGVNLWLACRAVKTKPDFGSVLIKPLIASVGMGMSCFVIYYTVYYIVPSNTLATAAAILAGIAVYIALMVLIRGIHRDDLALMPFGRRAAAGLERRGLL
jgi:stage V sporulation protein B